MKSRNQIRMERVALKCSQITLAKLSQVSRYRLSMFECGYRDLEKDEMNRVKATLNKIEKSVRKGVANG